MGACRTFKIDDALTMVVADGLYMRHLFGRELSVAIIKFVADKGSVLPARPHSHGWEVALQLRGGCRIVEIAPPEGRDPEHRVDEHEALAIEADIVHTGSNIFDAEGVCMRLDVVSPPRAEYGAEGTKPFYPFQNPPGTPNAG